MHRNVAAMATTLSALQGLRAVAATMVAIAHLLARLIKSEVVGPDWERFTIAGSAGVYVFFAISGFIMVKTSGQAFGEPGAPRAFFMRRLIRIIPIYYVFTMLLLLKLTLGNEPWTLQELAQSLLFIPYINSSGLMQPVYSLGWTLNYEMYFYAVFAACLFLRRPMGIAAIFMFIATIILLGQIFGTFDAIRDPKDVLGFYGSRVVLFFLAGMVIALLPTTISLRPGACFVAATALLTAGVLSANLIVVSIACVLSVLVASLEQTRGTKSSSLKALDLLGDASYSIYLTHSFVLGPAVYVGLKLGLLHGLMAGPYSIAAIGACIAVGVVSYLVLERPLLRYLRGALLGARTPMPLAKRSVPL